jgi:hypothetical protein
MSLLPANVSFCPFKHTLLQRLSNLPHLWALYVTHIGDLPDHGLEFKELAQQVVDIISIQPHLPLSYVALDHNCYEILEHPENHTNGADMDIDNTNANGAGNHAPTATTPTNVEIPSVNWDDTPAGDEEAAVDESDSDNSNHSAAVSVDNQSDTGSDMSDESSSSSSSGRRQYAGPPRFQVREILFYDDLVAIFRARHATL